MNKKPYFGAVEYYPRPYQYEVFAVRIFNEQRQELSYHIPSITTKPFIFATPRNWSWNLLEGLNMRILINV